MTFEPIWSGIIACYLFLGGLGGVRDECVFGVAPS